MIKEYLAYIKNNPNKLWFRRKLYGWGWTPATWQGWLTLLIFIILMVANVFRLDSMSHSDGDILINYISQTFILAIILIAICWKFGEKPRWQWGIKDVNKQIPPKK